MDPEEVFFLGLASKVFVRRKVLFEIPCSMLPLQTTIDKWKPKKYSLIHFDEIFCEREVLFVITPPPHTHTHTNEYNERSINENSRSILLFALALFIYLYFYYFAKGKYFSRFHTFWLTQNYANENHDLG